MNVYQIELEGDEPDCERIYVAQSVTEVVASLKLFNQHEDDGPRRLKSIKELYGYVFVVSPEDLK